MTPNDPGPQLSVWQKAEIARYLTRFPALTVMTFLRFDLGYRTLHPNHLLAVNGLLIFVVFLLGGYYPEAKFEHLFFFACGSLVLGLAQRSERWREYQQGKLRHSYYIGTSPFDYIRPPMFLKRQRRLARFADPALCILIGLHYLNASRALSLWLIFSGMCLRVFEDSVFRRELNQTMDVLDGLIVSGLHAQDIEKVERAPTKRRGKAKLPQSVPTGLGPDIAKKIRKR